MSVVLCVTVLSTCISQCHVLKICKLQYVGSVRHSQMTISAEIFGIKKSPRAIVEEAVDGPAVML